MFCIMCAVKLCNRTLQMTTRIENYTLITVEDMYLLMTNKVLPYLGMTAPNRSERDCIEIKMFSKQLLDIGNDKVAIDTSTGNITLSIDLVTSQTQKRSLLRMFCGHSATFQ